MGSFLVQQMSLSQLARVKLTDAEKLMANARENAIGKTADAQQLMVEASILLKQDLENATKENAVINEITKTLSKVHFANKIKLNVGGKFYTTTLDTLRRDPDSLLCAMFSGKFRLEMDEEDGAYFIDRDAELFRYVLNYLRDGNLFCPNDNIVQKELLAEARFYQIQGIITDLEEKIPFESTLILKNEAHHSILLSWLPPGATCSLLYQASFDGQTPADFHRCCDDRGPTLVVIRVGSYIFGGFTSKSWESACELKAKQDSHSFLFTLINPFGTKPMKIATKTDASTHCQTDLGPTFGTASTQCYDLQVWSTIGNNLDLGFGFKCPDNVNKKTFFCGTSPFQIDDLEVFKVIF